MCDRVRTLDGLLLVKRLDDDLTKYQISDVLIKEEEILSNLYKEFRIDINWGEKLGLASLAKKRKTITIIIKNKTSMVVAVNIFICMGSIGRAYAKFIILNG